MPAAGAPQTIRSRIEPFTSELTDLVTRSVLSQEQEALGPSPARPASDAGHGEKLGAGTRRTSTAPISFERYERMAIEHALEECSGAALAAAGLLGVGKSTLYRQMRRLRVGRSSSGHKAQDAIRLDGPPSLAAYERLALEHALAETGGDKFAAAKLLHVGKSTLYRKLARHGLG